MHFVTAELDGGPVIAQARVDVQAGDTPETLAARLLPHEHRLLVACVRALASRELRWSDSGIQFGGSRLPRPLMLAADGSLVSAENAKTP